MKTKKQTLEQRKQRQEDYLHTAGLSTQAIRVGTVSGAEQEHNDAIYATSSFIYGSAEEASECFSGLPRVKGGRDLETAHRRWGWGLAGVRGGRRGDFYLHPSDIRVFTIAGHPDRRQHHHRRGERQQRGGEFSRGLFFVLTVATPRLVAPPAVEKRAGHDDFASFRWRDATTIAIGRGHRRNRDCSSD